MPTIENKTPYTDISRHRISTIEKKRRLIEYNEKKTFSITPQLELLWNIDKTSFVQYGKAPTCFTSISLGLF